MHKYKVGWERRIAGAALLGRRWVHNAWGGARRWPVYRPWFDHSVYAYDNQHLPSTWESRAKLHHMPAWKKPLPGAAVVEFEHPFVLFGAPHAHTDLALFRQQLAEAVRSFFTWFEPTRHRLVGASQGAVDRLHALAAAHGHSVPHDAVEVLHWAGKRQRRQLPVPHPNTTLRVFHYGGHYPYAKGTHDVLAVAALLPDVHFEISAAPEHPLLRQQSRDNVTVHAYTNKRLYDAAMQRCHVLLSPVYSDGWGVVLDAMALAMPTVIYDSYDKREAVSHNETGMVVPLPGELSWFDGFNGFATWTAFNNHVAKNSSAERVQALADALRGYQLDHRRLLQHSRAAAARYRTRHHGPDRVARILHIYSQLLGQL